MEDSSKTVSLICRGDFKRTDAKILDSPMKNGRVMLLERSLEAWRAWNGVSKCLASSNKCLTSSNKKLLELSKEFN